MLAAQGRHLCAASVIRGAGKPAVARAACVEIAQSLPATLEKMAKELDAARYNCSHLLEAGEYQMVAVEAPNVPSNELKTAIRWRLKDLLDFHVDDATLDVLNIPADKNAPTRSHSMYAVAARNQVVQKRQELFEQTRINLSVIDIPEMAQRNIAALLETEGRALALLSFDAQGGLLTFTAGGELYLARRIDVSAEQLTQADEAQRATVLERIVLEVQRSLDHFERQYHFISVVKLLLAPGGESISALRNYLGSNLYLPVECIALQDVFDTSAAPWLATPQAQQQMFLTLGAALRQEERVL